MAAAQSSTRGAPSRRFIYLIMDGGNGIQTLHRIDTNPLFAAAGGRAQAHHGVAGATRLPPPLARFECTAGRQFLPLGRDVEKIVSVDSNRHTVIFDTRTEAVRAGPDARHVKWHGHGSTWAEAGGRLYHLGRGPGFDEQPCLDFEALSYDGHRDDWFWSLLPSPPFERWHTSESIDSFADAGAGAGVASAIRVSARGRTYAFDAAQASWRKQGDWALPFCGRAQYVADYGLWFGFADSQAADLCAADLNVAGRPVRRHVWANIDGYANHTGSYLSYLGSGRFCVTRFFPEKDTKDGRSILTLTAVVTAVEATRGAASANGVIRMVSRGSVCYRSPGCGSPCWARGFAY